jgi:endonuclease YncB( thermonuclease family)
MLRRRKPDGGFEWHEYIRTTIKVRRDARHQRVQDARRAAGQQMRAAGVALAEGSLAAGEAAVQGARAGAGALSLAAQGMWAFSVYLIRAILRPLARLVARPNIGGPLAFAGAIALGAGIGRARVVGLDREAGATLLLGAVLLLCLLPMLERRTTWRPPLRLRRAAGWAFALAVLAGGAAWLASASGVAGLGVLAGIDRLPLVGAGQTVRGTAYAEGGDRLRIADTLVRLTGIEAPEAGQQCSKAGRSWRCGAAAESALARLVNGRRATCTLSGSDDAGRPLGRCTVGTKDVGAELVRQGHAFAEGGLLPRYAGEEREARAAKVGLWSGEAERPADWRAKVWEEAKGKSPEGCPITGQVTGSSRYYVLPWSADYERTRVRETRGERWFCSEQDAIAAGFKARG